VVERQEPRFGADGLVCAVVQDHGSGAVLMVAWMDREAWERTLGDGLATFHSRSRGRLWRKGETSGNVMRVRAVRLDCDRDAVLLVVDPAGPACHTGAPSCFFQPVPLGPSPATSWRHEVRPSQDGDMTDDTRLYFNPSCSNCQTARGLLEERGVEARIVEYLDHPPTRQELEELMGLLGIDDPRGMIREKEPEYAGLGLATADRDAVLDAIVAHPILLQRPIVVLGDRAVIARPPELLLDLLP
jgi:phosphoribosyl-AMP cyclohydrolase